MARRRKRTASDKKENASVLASMATGADYDLMRAPQDFLRWRTPIELFILRRLIPIDHWYEEKKPVERGERPWVEVLDENEENTVYQVIASMIRPSTRKTQGMIDGRKIVVQFDPELNPLAFDDDIGLAGAALTDIFLANNRNMLGNQISEVSRLVMLRGMYFRQSELVTNLDDDQYSGNCPIRQTVHDPFDVSWDVGPDQFVKRLILRKTVTWAMIPEGQRIVLELEREPAWDRQLRCYEVWTDTHHGVLINGRVAKKMTPHGYPRCPFTVAMHQPTPMRQHMAPPRSGTWQPMTAYWIGRPVCEDLLEPAEVDSRLMTSLLENVKRTAITPLAGKGLMLREDEDIVDAIQQGFIPLEDNTTSDVRFVTPPDGVSNGLRFKQEYDKRTTDVAGASPEQYSGQVKDRVAGIAQSEMTSWTRGAADAIRMTITEEIGRHAMLDAEILADYYRPSTYRKIQRDAPELIEMLGDMLDLPRDDGKAYPDYERITGSKERVIDGYTFEFLREATVKIPPAQLFSIEQGHNVGLQIANLPPERMLISRRTIMERYLQIENVDAELAQVHTEELMADPQLPIGKLLRLRAWMQTQAPELGKHYVDELDADIDKAIPQAVKQSIESIVQQFMPAPDLPSNAAAAPPPNPMMGGGAPGGPLPPGGPPQARPPIPPQGPSMMGGPPPGPPQGMPPRGPMVPAGAPQAPPPRGILPSGMPPQAMGG
jgi:hypothetical protein